MCVWCVVMCYVFDVWFVVLLLYVVLLCYDDLFELLFGL